MKRCLAIAFATFTACTVVLVAIEAEYLRPTGSEASARPYCALGDYYLIDLKDHAKAMECYTIAANRKPKNYVEYAKAMNNLAALCYLAGQNGRAQVYIDKAIELAPSIKHFHLTRQSIQQELERSAQ